MLNLSFSGQFNNYISKDLIRPPPFEIVFWLLPDHFNCRRFLYEQISETLQGDDLPPRSY